MLTESNSTDRNLSLGQNWAQNEAKEIGRKVEQGELRLGMDSTTHELSTAVYLKKKYGSRVTGSDVKMVVDKLSQYLPDYQQRTKQTPGIIKHEPFTLEKHIVPILEKYEMRWQWGQGDYGAREGIVVEDGYIGIVNRNDLYVEGTQRLAEFLHKNVRPFGKELTIHLYPQKVTLPPDMTGQPLHRKLLEWVHSLKYLRIE